MKILIPTFLYKRLSSCSYCNNYQIAIYTLQFSAGYLTFSLHIPTLFLVSSILSIKYFFIIYMYKYRPLLLNNAHYVCPYNYTSLCTPINKDNFSTHSKNLMVLKNFDLCSLNSANVVLVRLPLLIVYGNLGIKLLHLVALEM